MCDSCACIFCVVGLVIAILDIVVYLVGFCKIKIDDIG